MVQCCKLHGVKPFNAELANSHVRIQIGAMTMTPRPPTELEIPGARRITVETCFSASVRVMAEVNGNAKDTHPCIRLALVSGAS